MQEKLIIHCDEYNWTLTAQRVVSKKGSKNMGGTYEHTIGFFSTLATLAKYANERQLRVHGLKDYEEARDELQRVLDDTIAKLNVHECGSNVKACINADTNSTLTKQKRGRKKTE